MDYSAETRDDLERRVRESERELAVLRELTVESWVKIALAGDLAVAARPADQGAVEQELAAMRETLSWRVTAPLRAVRRRM